MNFFEKELFAFVRVFFNTSFNVFVLDPGCICVHNYNSGFFYVTTRQEVSELSAIKEKFIIINLSGANISTFPFDFSLIEGILSFTQSDENINGFFIHDIFYINDTDGHLRWLLSSDHRINDFMDELDEPRTNVDINNFFSLYPYIINYLRLKTGKVGKIADGKIRVWKKAENLINGTEDSLWKSFSVNFYKYISRGIMVFKFYKEKYLSNIYKIAFEECGTTLISNEQNIIENYSGGIFKFMSPPEITIEKDATLIYLEPPVRDMDYHLTYKNIDKIINGLNEIYSFSFSEITISEFLLKKNILNYLNLTKYASEQKLIPKGVSNINIDRLLNSLFEILNSLNTGNKILVSVSINNMSPENMIISGEKIVLLNFEKAEEEMPMFFDLFDYSFSHAESFENPDSDILAKELNSFYKNTGILAIINKFKIDYYLYLKLFILNRSIYEFINFLDKKIIRPEINLKLFLWYEMIERLIKQ